MSQKMLLKYLPILIVLFSYCAGTRDKRSYSGRDFDAKSLSLTSNKITAQSWDIPGRMQEDPLEDNTLQALMSTSFLRVIGNLSQETQPFIDDLDTDVYSGGVSDPWNEKSFSSNTQQLLRKKRSVNELYSMIKCSTGCDPLIYKGYGCYCGFLGDGQPIDGIDQCCKLHDQCYSNSNCESYTEYFVPYTWKCYRGKPVCAMEFDETKSCPGILCRCDAQLSRCLRRFGCPQTRGICRSSPLRKFQNVLLNYVHQ